MLPLIFPICNLYNHVIPAASEIRKHCSVEASVLFGSFVFLMLGLYFTCQCLRYILVFSVKRKLNKSWQFDLPFLKVVFSLLLLALVEIGNWRSSAPSISPHFHPAVYRLALCRPTNLVCLFWKLGRSHWKTQWGFVFKPSTVGTNYPVRQHCAYKGVSESMLRFWIKNLWTLRICPCLLFSWPNGVRLFVTPWTAALQAPLSLTISQSLPKFMSTELVISSDHLILCHPLLLLPSVFACIRVLSNESAIYTRWLKYESLHRNEV